MNHTPESPIFGDFDDPAVYTACEQSLWQLKSRNFVIEFDDKDARCARDVGEASMDLLLRADGSAKLTTRWINIWCPEQQRQLVHVLSTRYKFSPRLEGIMSSKHKRKDEAPPSRHSGLSLHGSRKENPTEPRSPDTQASLSEKSDYMIPMGINEPMDDVNHYKVVNEVWHYSSVDRGSACG